MQRIAQRLAELKREALREWQRRAKERERVRGASPFRGRAATWRGYALVALQSALQLIAIVALPFAVLVRGSVFFYEHGRVPPWLALLTAGFLAAAVITAYASWLWRKVTGQSKVMTVAQWVGMPLVVFYCGYALVYLSRVNAKAEPVRAYYTSVHPLLRLALSTWILVDPDIVITDVQRAREDYARMRLPVNERSLHYRQRDGWVHAVDLRTARRGAIKNALVRVYFWTMGFETIRHGGTGDHLHVELGAGS